MSSWHADHIVPVVDGGGACGLDNLRTLCWRCHRSETRKLRRRLAAMAAEGAE
ncbi:MAG TPA: HNH endonuclease signature motif containing protein [Anaerolineae bacterium]|nr:HNH endonuclease signature motif containing protein [Anaerolineae bacterium]